VIGGVAGAWYGLPFERAGVVDRVHVVFAVFVVGEREAIGFVRPGEHGEQRGDAETSVNTSVSW